MKMKPISRKNIDIHDTNKYTLDGNELCHSFNDEPSYIFKKNGVIYKYWHHHGQMHRVPDEIDINGMSSCAAAIASPLPVPGCQDSNEKAYEFFIYGEKLSFEEYKNHTLVKLCLLSQ